MTKKDMLKCYKDLSSCDMDKIEHVVSAIYKAFDTDNDGKVGMYECFYSCCFQVLDWLWFVCIDFREFALGFLLTTKGSMEEKLDYTFQIYGKILFNACKQRNKIELNLFFLDIDKNGYIDQSEIDVMAKVLLYIKIVSQLFNLLCFVKILVCIQNVRWQW